MRSSLHIKWLKDEGAIVEEDNVIHASRAFMANSVLKWCTKKIKEKSLNKIQIEDYLKTVRFFIKKRIDLCWKNGIITASVCERATTANKEK